MPTWCRLTPRPERRVERLVASSPLDSVSLENMNLVFLKQELTTTGKFDGRPIPGVQQAAVCFHIR